MKVHFLRQIIRYRTIGWIGASSLNADDPKRFCWVAAHHGQPEKTDNTVSAANLVIGGLIDRFLRQDAVDDGLIIQTRERTDQRQRRLADHPPASRLDRGVNDSDSALVRVRDPCKDFCHRRKGCLFMSRPGPTDQQAAMAGLVNPLQMRHADHGKGEDHPV